MGVCLRELFVTQFSCTRIYTIVVSLNVISGLSVSKMQCFFLALYWYTSWFFFFFKLVDWFSYAYLTLRLGFDIITYFISWGEVELLQNTAISFLCLFKTLRYLSKCSLAFLANDKLNVFFNVDTLLINMMEPSVSDLKHANSLLIQTSFILKLKWNSLAFRGWKQFRFE